jgi:hypothetical protein
MENVLRGKATEAKVERIVAQEARSTSSEPKADSTSS